MLIRTVEKMVDKATFSEHLSRVLEDIGINNNIIEKRRETYQSIEAMYRIHSHPTITRFFGSQTEGTTIIDMKSDLDMLYIKTEWNVMQSKRDKKLGKPNMRLVKDDSTAPGYCRLHLLDKKDILLLCLLPAGIQYAREKENICVLNDVMFAYFQPQSTFVNVEQKRRGPSKQSSRDPSEGDEVAALLLSSWPAESESWLRNDRQAKWPTRQMRSVIKKHQCLLVPVGHPRSDRPRAEWRISYSETERYLMFEMKVVQLQCYVLLKIIRNRFLLKKIKSYHLKSVLLYTIERTDKKVWVPQVLFDSVLKCLKTLSLWLQLGYCPHFFNSKVNLFDGNLSMNVRRKLHCRLTTLLEMKYEIVYRIKHDDLGLRMKTSLKNIANSRDFVSADNISSHIQLSLEYLYIKYKSFFVNSTFQKGEEIFFLKMILHYFRHGTQEEKAAAMTLLPDVLAQFASISVAASLLEQRPVNENLFWYLTFGTPHELIPTSLKLATIYYMTGHAKKSLEIICRLDSFESVTKRSLFTSCWGKYALWSWGFLSKGSQFAGCVQFSRKEKSICPYQLILEMYRSTKYDRGFRTGDPDGWKDSAEIDPLPYMYYIKFLSYKTLKLDKQADEAIIELISIARHMKLRHRETVYNILGQYFESIMGLNEALWYYSLSLLYRPVDNAAKWLLGVLVYTKLFKKISKLVACCRKGILYIYNISVNLIDRL